MARSIKEKEEVRMGHDQDSRRYKSPLHERLESLASSNPSGQTRRIQKIVTKKAAFRIEEAKLNDQLTRELGDALGITRLFSSSLTRVLWRIARERIPLSLGKTMLPRIDFPERTDIASITAFDEQLAPIVSKLLGLNEQEECVEDENSSSSQ